MAQQTDIVRATSQGRAAALTVLLDDDQSRDLDEMGFSDAWRNGPGADIKLPDNPYAGGRLAEAWEDGFSTEMGSRSA